MYTKFVVLAKPRTGSSYLRSALMNHPDIYMHGEIFSDSIDRHILEEARDAIDLTTRKEKPIKFIRNLYNYNEGKSAVGFKFWRNHSPKGCKFLLKNESIKKVILERRNVLASYSSTMIARESGIWNKKNIKNYEPPKIKFDEQDFIKYLNAHNNYFYGYYKQQIEDHKQNSLLVDYQKHIMTDEMNFILDFLELPKSDSFSGNRVKLNGTHILERFDEQEHPKIIHYLKSIDKLEWLNEEAE